jgi:high frequency lysogenization protein
MSIKNTTLALAGIYQSAELVRQIAQQGAVEAAPFEASIRSIFKIDADSTADVYGGLGGVRTGLLTLSNHLRRINYNAQEKALMRYVSSVMILERKLFKRRDLLIAIRLGVEDALKLTRLYEPVDQKIINYLSSVYFETLQPIHYPIPVLGEARYIENDQNINTILALILAGLRSAVLWRQVGGNRFQLLWARIRIIRTAQQLIDHIKQSSQ